MDACMCLCIHVFIQGCMHIRTDIHRISSLPTETVSSVCGEGCKEKLTTILSETRRQLVDREDVVHQPSQAAGQIALRQWAGKIERMGMRARRTIAHARGLYSNALCPGITERTSTCTEAHARRSAHNHNYIITGGHSAGPWPHGMRCPPSPPRKAGEASTCTHTLPHMCTVG